MYLSYVTPELKRVLLDKFALKLGISCIIAAAVWYWNGFWTKEYEKKVILFLYKPTKNGIFTWPWPKRKESSTTSQPNNETSCDHNQKRCVHERKFAASRSFFNFTSQKLITTFSFQRPKPKGSQQYCFVIQTHLCKLCGLSKMRRENESTFLVQKRFQLFGSETQNQQETLQQRLSSDPKPYNGRSRFQPVLAVEESAAHCSKKLS